MSFEGRKLHLIGVGGAGMSGLALAANQLGAEVSGSDRSESSYVERLREAGISVTIGHDAANLPDHAEIVVSTAIAADNPELVAARERGATVLHRSELLAELAALKPRQIAVAGTHGKTTTTAMIAHVLEVTGRDPSFFVGGEVTIGARTTNAHIGGGEHVVIEADESDGSFLRYDPEVAVITNIEFEHPETWSGLDELIEAFAAFAQKADSVVIEAGQPRRDELGVADRTTTFAIAPQPADYAAAAPTTPPEAARGTSFRLGERVVELGVRGEHNVKNALAALAVLELVGVPVEEAIPALVSFNGVARRFEHIGVTRHGADVYDDYAHHPTELRAALSTARGAVGEGRLVVVYQPHLFSRSIAYRREFGEALALADVIVVLDIYPSRELAENFPGISGWIAATAAADAAPGAPVYYAPSFDDAEQLLDRILRAGDLCLAAGAGTVISLSSRLVETRQ